MRYINLRLSVKMRGIVSYFVVLKKHNSYYYSGPVKSQIKQITHCRKSQLNTICYTQTNIPDKLIITTQGIILKAFLALINVQIL